MTDQPLVSVVVTNYNHAQFIQQAVKSIEEQTYPNIELIIVDDKSTDDSEVHLKDFESRGHKVIRLPENRGKWFALNTAIAQANGKLITLQDADDASVKERIDTQVKCLLNSGSYHNLCSFFHCHSQDEMDRAQTYEIEPGPSQVLGHKDVVKLVHKGWKTPGINHYFLGNFEAHGASSLFYKQHWEMGMKFHPGNIGLRVQKAEDSDHNTRMTLLLQKTSFINLPLYCYRRGTGTNPAWKEDL